MLNEKPIIDESTTVIVTRQEEPKGNPLVNKRISKLIGQKSIQLAKDEALEASSTINESDLDELLSPDEKRFYQIKRQAYLTSYPDLLEDQFDLDDLHLMIMEQVYERRLWKKNKKHPSLDITKDRQESIRRQQDLKKALNVRRTDRLKTKGEKGPKISIANLSLQFGGQEEVNVLDERIRELEKDEEKLRLKKRIDQ